MLSKLCRRVYWFIWLGIVFIYFCLLVSKGHDARTHIAVLALRSLIGDSLCICMQPMRVMVYAKYSYGIGEKHENKVRIIYAIFGLLFLVFIMIYLMVPRKQ